MKRKCCLWAMLAMLIGMMGAGCRESNPAYLRTTDAARERHSNASADLAAPADMVSVDTESADRALPNPDNRDAEAVTDTRVADVSLDASAIPPDVSVDGTVGADSLLAASDAWIAADAVDNSPDALLVLADGAGVGLDTNVDMGVDVSASLDAEGDRNVTANPDTEGDLDVGANPDVEGDLGADVEVEVDAGV